MKISWRLWVLFGALLLSVLVISPQPWREGVAISSVTPDSPASQAGMSSPANLRPVSRELVLSINEVAISSVKDFEIALSTLKPNSSVRVLTDKNSYVLFLPEVIDEDDPLGFSVAPAAKSNIRLGLDLTGGVRALMKPAEPVDDQTMSFLIDSVRQRIDAFGLADVIVKPTSDFSGNQYLLVEIAGANKQAILDLLTSQGVFEAKIGNVTVFSSGDDISYVGTTAQDSGVQRCSPSSAGYTCEFRFSLTLSKEAAERQAAETAKLTVVNDGTGSYLSKNLDLFLDGRNISSLRIGASLRGQPVQQISISGSESGPTQQAAYQAAVAEMHKLQTLLQTGSLPVELEIVKIDSISPSLGSSFIKNIWIVGIIVIFAVTLVVALRYRDWKVSVPMISTMLSEVVIILGVSALFNQAIDLASIAGILVAIGTGVDDQIVMVDEIKSNKSRRESFNKRLKKAFFVIFAAYFTLVSAMFPLIYAGAGLVRGFAIITIAGVTAGVLVTRPAFAAIAEKVLKD